MLVTLLTFLNVPIRHCSIACLPLPTMIDHNPRPLKRARLDSSPQMYSSSLSSLTTIPSSPMKSHLAEQEPRLKPLPPAVLLVSLPALLAHPPTHKYYIQSICLSLCALKKCLTIPALSPEIECRAWTGLAEVGMRVIAGGLHENEDSPWARGIEVEVRRDLALLCYVFSSLVDAYMQVDKALSKAVCTSRLSARKAHH